ncbi:MAG: hypothetical protein IE917_20590, partial [Betaproteobacteria bacterium]|nr:hypothetical protein [Betaproteobacteria bacterium]
MNQSTLNTVEQTALTTAEQLLPVILAGVQAGVGASNPYVATIEAIAPVIVKLIQMQQAGAPELAQIMAAITSGVTSAQAQ